MAIITNPIRNDINDNKQKRAKLFKVISLKINKKYTAVTIKESVAVIVIYKFKGIFSPNFETYNSRREYNAKLLVNPYNKYFISFITKPSHPIYHSQIELPIDLLDHQNLNSNMIALMF